MLPDLGVHTVFLFTVAVSDSVAVNVEEAFLQALLLIAYIQQVCQHCTHSCVLWQFGHVGQLLFAESYWQLLCVCALDFQSRSPAARALTFQLQQAWRCALWILLSNSRHLGKQSSYCKTFWGSGGLGCPGSSCWQRKEPEVSVLLTKEVISA